jgi:hypothetical protein
MSQRARWREWLLVLALLALVGGAVGFFFWPRPPRDDSGLDEEIAALDRAEPGWRLADLLDARKPLADERNGALCAEKAARLCPPEWPDWQLSAEAEDVPPEKALPPELAGRVRRELDRTEAALEEARRLADLPDGRGSVRYDPADPARHLLEIGASKRVADLLLFDAFDRLQRQDTTGALRSCRAVFNAGRVAGAGPLAISQLVRLACGRRACRLAARVLAQAEAAPDELAVFQSALAEEDRFPLFETVVRGERGYAHDVLSNLAKKEWPLADDADDWGLTGAERRSADLQRIKLRAAHAEHLRASARMLEIARLPLHQRAEALAALAKEQQPVKSPAASVVRACCALDNAERLAKAHSRCLIVAIAAERYRQARGEWPASPDALVPGYLDAVPLDPFDGRPVRYRLADGGVIVYSVGPDGVDNKGRLASKNPNEPGTDLGWRLWPTPRPPKAHEEDR